ncbi:tail fiber domain-containing protein [Lacinutrix sp. MEBiC02404]
MKNTILSIALLLIIQFTFAQGNSINYKAIVKDNLGNVVANQNITVQFIIRKGLANVYQETHTPTTNANGVIIVNIGEGTTSDDFSTIDWGENDHFLNVQIDTGNGLIDLGTTQFKTVPYASFATEAGNVSGLESINEGTGPGWRLKGKNPIQFGNIGNLAVDLSTSFEVSDDHGATGNRSFAVGTNTIASNSSTAAFGFESEASGGNSTAMGYRTKAEALASLAIGSYNVGGGAPSNFASTNPLFEVGNGTNTNTRSNALTVLQNGTVTAPSFDLAEITDPKALITKEYADINLVTSGLEAIDEGNGIGYRIKGTNPANYGNIGIGATDLNINSIASTTYGATGNKSFAQGSHTTASGYGSVAMGNFTNASGIMSTAMGDYTISSGTASTALGRNTKASANYATSLGKNTKAEALSNTAIGQYNIGGGSLTNWLSTDPLFEIGNGTSTNNLSNALTVLKNGRVGIGKHSDLNGMLEIEGNSSLSKPQLSLVENNAGFARLKFTNSNRPGNGYWDIAGFIGEQGIDDRLNFFSSYQGNILSLGGFGDVDLNGWLEIKNDIGIPLLILKSEGINTVSLRMQGSGRGGNDRWDIDAFISGTSSSLDRLTFNNSDGGDIMYMTGSGNVFVNGNLAHASDKRLKRDIETIDFGIAEILKLNPVQYNWKDKENKPYKSLGVIAQEIEEIIPNVVQIGDDSTQMLSVSYTELIPVLIKAIQEQQAIIQEQETKIASQDDKYTSLEKMVLSMASKMEGEIPNLISENTSKK